MIDVPSTGPDLRVIDPQVPRYASEPPRDPGSSGTPRRVSLRTALGLCLVSVLATGVAIGLAVIGGDRTFQREVALGVRPPDLAP